MSKILQSLKKCDIQFLPALYIQTAQFGTKPRWVPKAKTKIFRVPPRKEYPPEETLEFKRLWNHYRTKMKSAKLFFDEVHRANETSEEVLQRLEQEKEEHWKQCMELNDKWNAEIAIQRAERDAEELEKDFEAAREEMRIKDQKEKERLEKLEEIIRQEKEASKHFITENNIDEHIEKILSSPPHTFYRAIDRNGNIYSGLSSTPDIVNESENEETREVSGNS